MHDPSATVVLSALATCTTEERYQFYDLANCRVGDGRAVEWGIFETNVLPCGPKDAKSGHAAAQGGIFLLGSRLNSSCAPNVNNNWDEETRRLVFRAVRDIAVGEELCIAYGNALAGRDERRAELETKFGFVCRCEACLLDGEALQQSNYRRTCLNEMYREHIRGLSGDPMEILGEVSVSVFCRVRRSHTFIRNVTQVMLALKYLRDENLVVYGSVFYRTGFTLCAAVSDYVNAEAWAKKAYELTCTAYGERRAETWKILAQDPRVYEEAGVLGRRTLAGPDALAWSYLGLM